MEHNDLIQNEDLHQKAGIQAAAARVDDLTVLKNLLGPKTDPNHRPEFSDEGREVKLKDALTCIEDYTPAMAAHGIRKIIEGPAPKIGKARMITESEEFGGENLLAWMLKTARKYDPEGQGKNMGIRLSLGIYNEVFLNTYLSANPKLKDKKRDRITIFLVPYHANGIQKKLEDDDATAYDLGGLQP